MIEKLNQKTVWFLSIVVVVTAIFAWTVDFDKLTAKFPLEKRAEMIMEKK